jgi:hypothetical protein
MSTQELSPFHGFDAVEALMSQLDLGSAFGSECDEDLKKEWEQYVEEWCSYKSDVDESAEDNLDAFEFAQQHEWMLSDEFKRKDDESFMDHLLRLKQHLDSSNRIGSQDIATLSPRNQRQRACQILHSHSTPYKTLKTEWHAAAMKLPFESQDRCVCCLSTFRGKHLVVPFLPCGHLFHVRCLTRWVKQSDSLNSANSCPTCRSKLEDDLYATIFKPLIALTISKIDTC